MLTLLTCETFNNERPDCSIRTLKYAENPSVRR